MKTLKKIISAGLIVLAMAGASVTYAQNEEAQLRASLQAQLRTLLIQLVEQLQNELAQLQSQESEVQVLGNYSYRELKGDIEYEVEEDEVNINITGVLSDSCSVPLQPTIKEKNRVFDIKLLERKALDMVCATAEVPYGLDTDIDTEDLRDGNYTVNINGKEEFTFKVDNAKPLPVFGNSNISTQVLSSSSATPNDVASFKFVVNVSPFDNPIYIPVSAVDAVSFDVIDAATNSNTAGMTNASLGSNANRVDGNDGNEYFQISRSEKMTVTLTARPGSGDYYAELDALKFTNQDVTDSSFTSFSPIKIVMSNRVWRTETVTLIN